MSTFVIGDVQGCWEQLQALLQRLPFDPKQDTLWLTGDLVNRGPRSLDVLRWAAAQGPALRVVLGNHDLKLLGCAYGIESAGTNPSLSQVLEAKDRIRLLEWLLSQPLLVRGDNQHIMIHGGLEPAWSVERAQTLAEEAAQALRTRPEKVLRAFFDRHSQHPPDHPARVLSVLTLTRMVDARGRLDFAYNGTPQDAPEGYTPWFTRRAQEQAVFVFGHWAALGFYTSPRAVCVDSGCVWGGALTAYCLEDGRVFQVPGYVAS